MRLSLLAALSLVTCIGCVTTLTVTYHSDPAGATLYEGTRNLGMCPVKRTYDIPDEALEKKRILLPSTTARWVSGASRTDRYAAELQSSTSHQFTFIRPKNAPNLELDASFAARLLTGKPIDITPTPAPREPAQQASPPLRTEVKHPKQHVCPVCKGLKGYGKCPACLGVGYITKGCSDCVGSGTNAYGQTCPSCGGQGYIKVPCTRCNGSGFEGVCPACKGLGYVVDE